MFGSHVSIKGRSLCELHCTLSVLEPFSFCKTRGFFRFTHSEQRPHGQRMLPGRFHKRFKPRPTQTFPPSNKPGGYIGLAPGCCFFCQRLGDTHTHGGGVGVGVGVKRFLCLILGGRWRALRPFLPLSVYSPTGICGPDLSSGGRGGGSSLICAVCYGSWGECAVSQIWCRSGCCPSHPELFVAFGRSFCITDGARCSQERVLMLV